MGRAALPESGRVIWSMIVPFYRNPEKLSECEMGITQEIREIYIRNAGIP